MPVLQGTPPISSFVEAQNELREKMGTPITFKIPIPPTYAEGVKINPDTGEPYEALAPRTNAEFEDVVKTCLIIQKQASPLRPQADTQMVAAGERLGLDIIVDIATADYDAVEAATEMLINGLEYRVREAKPFSTGDTVYRYLIYGQVH